MDSDRLFILVFVCVFLLISIILLIIIRHQNKELKEFVLKELNNKKLQDLQSDNILNQNMADIKAALNKDLNEFNSRLNNDLNHYSYNTLNRISVIEEKLKNELFENKNEINERLSRIDSAQKDLNSLSNDILSLQSILQDKKTRGVFGEIELYSLLDSVYGNSKLYERQYRLSNGCIADAYIYCGGEGQNICVDSKFPLENYNRIFSETDAQKARVAFKRDIVKHINDIADKYIIPGETASMAYMFVPAEAVFAEIYASYEDVIRYSYEKKVYIVSPSTLMAYLTAIRSIYLSFQKNQKTEQIEKLLNELSIEFNRLNERREALQRDFEKIIPDFERVATSSNKIIKKFAHINNGELNEED